MRNHFAMPSTKRIRSAGCCFISIEKAPRPSPSSKQTAATNVSASLSSCDKKTTRVARNRSALSAADDYEDDAADQANAPQHGRKRNCLLFIRADLEWPG